MSRYETGGSPWRAIAAGVVLIAATGCEEERSRPATVDVSGAVTLAGSPAEGVEVYFENEGFSGYGKTDSQGRFRLVQGAVPGLNKVYLSKFEGGGMALDPESGMDEMQLRMAAESADGRGMPQVPRQVIPPEFSDPATGALTFDVPKGGTDAADFSIPGR